MLSPQQNLVPPTDRALFPELLLFQVELSVWGTPGRKDSLIPEMHESKWNEG